MANLTKAQDKMIAGVCGGLANSWDQDPTLIRVLYVVFTLITGLLPGILIYIVLALIMD